MKKDFFYKMLCNDQGQPSSMRVLLILVVSMTVIWINQIVCETGKIPDVPEGLRWVIGILSGVVGVSYAKAFTKGPDDGDTPSN